MPFPLQMPPPLLNKFLHSRWLLDATIPDILGYLEITVPFRYCLITIFFPIAPLIIPSGKCCFFIAVYFTFYKNNSDKRELQNCMPLLPFMPDKLSKFSIPGMMIGFLSLFSLRNIWWIIHSSFDHNVWMEHG